MNLKYYFLDLNDIFQNNQVNIQYYYYYLKKLLKETALIQLIDYPNDESRRKFNEAKINGEIPKDAEIGGEVGIHGTPENGEYLIDDKVNWTWGCISLKRDDVDEIYPYINESTEIIIVK